MEDGHSIRCGQAVAFVLSAVEYLVTGGQILAILPSNALNSQKDAAAIRYLERKGTLEILNRYGRGTFASCTSQTVSVRFTLSAFSKRQNDGKKTAITKSPRINVEVIRGSSQMHTVGRLRRGLIPVVHSTNLAEHSVVGFEGGVREGGKVITGPAVLIPRVGRPDPGKLALYNAMDPIVLSDCVIAIICESASDALYLLNSLIDRWDDVMSLFHGTCAPYITLNDLRNFLTNSGIAGITRHACESVKLRPPTAASRG
jgi:hypothetical protein